MENKKLPILVNCSKEEKDFITKVAKRVGTNATTFMRNAALENAKSIMDENKKTWVEEALAELSDIEKIERDSKKK